MQSLTERLGVPPKKYISMFTTQKCRHEVRNDLVDDPPHVSGTLDPAATEVVLRVRGR